MNHNSEIEYDDGAEDETAPRRRGAFSDIDMLEMGRDIWGGRYLILILLVAAFFWSIFAVAMAKPVYTAAMLVGPPQEESGGAQSLSGVLGQASGAAALFGLGFGGLNTTTFAKYSSLLESYALAGAVFKHDEVKPLLFGPTWNPKSRTWVRPSGFTFEAKEIAKGVLGMQRWATPSVETVHDKLQRVLVVTPDKLKGYLTITVNGESPQGALQLLKVVYKEADQLLRNAAIERLRNRIKFLTGELKNVEQQDQRTAIINVLSTQEQKIMMASADQTVAVEVIDPPHVDALPTWPKPRVILVESLFYAAVIGSLWSIIYGFRQRSFARKTVVEGGRVPMPRTADAAAMDYIRRLFRRSSSSGGSDFGIGSGRHAD